MTLGSLHVCPIPPHTPKSQLSPPIGRHDDSMSAPPPPPPNPPPPRLPPPPRFVAGPQVAKTKQQIEEQRAQVQVVERSQQAQLQEHEIGRRERELEATVRKPAEAERFRLERLAEAER